MSSPPVSFSSRRLSSLAFAGAYFVWSIINWFKLRQWLTRAGPFEVSQEAVETLRAQVEFWQAQAFSSAEEVQNLTRRLEESHGLIESLYELALPGEVDRPQGADTLSPSDEEEWVAAAVKRSDVDRTLRKNRLAVERAERRIATLDQAARRSERVVEQALRRLREAGYIR